MLTDYTTLLIKLPPELKGSFQGLCKARGVSMNAELRRFIADEVASAATGMTTNDRPPAKKVIKKLDNTKNARAVVTSSHVQRCDKTGDLFSKQPTEAQDKLETAFRAAAQADQSQNVTDEQAQRNMTLFSAISASKKRKTRKKPKK